MPKYCVIHVCNRIHQVHLQCIYYWIKNGALIRLTLFRDDMLSFVKETSMFNAVYRRVYGFIIHSVYFKSFDTNEIYVCVLSSNYNDHNGN